MSFLFTWRLAFITDRQWGKPVLKPSQSLVGLEYDPYPLEASAKVDSKCVGGCCVLGVIVLLPPHSGGSVWRGSSVVWWSLGLPTTQRCGHLSIALANTGLGTGLLGILPRLGAVAARPSCLNLACTPGCSSLTLHQGLHQTSGSHCIWWERFGEGFCLR